MEISNQLTLSYYKEIAVINTEHDVYLVQHIESRKFYVKKILDVYNIGVYKFLSKHPIVGTPRIIEFVEDSGRLVLIEEYISGWSLEELIEERRLDDQMVLRTGISLCEILEYLHNVTPSIVHRDVKPSNIILTYNMQPVLLDFNAARFTSGEKSSDTVLLGTHGYAAPEQYGFGSSSHLTDIYSLGITLKEMVESVPDSRLDLGMIIEKCTEISPKDRYQSVGELREHLCWKLRQLQDGMREDHENRGSAERNGAMRDDLSETSWKQFLPVGFRSGTPLKMIISIPVYLILIYLCATLKMEGTPLVYNIFNNILVFLAFYSSAAVPFNYAGMQNIMPLCRKDNRLARIAGIILLIGLIVGILLLIDIVAYALLVGTSIG